MRCNTCGENLAPGDARCPTCGAAQSRAVDRPSAYGAADVQRCPRCGFRGESVPYFSRPGHVGLLVGVSLFTYGIGGLVYWLARRRHRICRNCGLGSEYGVLESPVGGRREALPPPPVKLPGGGGMRRFAGAAMVLLASFLIMMGILEIEAAMVVVGSVMGAAGSGTFFWGWKALQERRQALTARVQREVLRLAEVRGGSLTVTEVAAELDLSLPGAERILIGMDDGFRVRSEITDDGIIVYEFPEVLHRGQLRGGGG
ncbi:MAG: hypothetical protein RQ751_12480 [Longimicrobiales bacterium]|nr:hypothetical protein [Longimicrobiales bacterium]